VLHVLLNAGCAKPSSPRQASTAIFVAPKSLVVKKIDSVQEGRAETGCPDARMLIISLASPERNLLPPRTEPCASPLPIKEVPLDRFTRTQMHTRLKQSEFSSTLARLQANHVRPALVPLRPGVPPKRGTSTFARLTDSFPFLSGRGSVVSGPVKGRQGRLSFKLVGVNLLRKDLESGDEALVRYLGQLSGLLGSTSSVDCGAHREQSRTVRTPRGRRQSALPHRWFALHYRSLR
jgi:hypothetical protein